MGLGFRFGFAFLSVLVLLVFVVGESVPCFGVDSGDALAAVSDAEARVAACYRAVADAERAGANVNGLLSVLNEAGWLLSKAKLAYSLGDFDSAFAYANECQSKLDGFVDQAENLRGIAEKVGDRDFLVNFVFRGAGALVIVVFGSVVWILLKRHGKAKE